MAGSIRESPPSSHIINVTDFPAHDNHPSALQRVASLANRIFNYFFNYDASEAARGYAGLSFMQRALRLAVFKTADADRYLFEGKVPFTKRYIKFFPLSFLFGFVYPSVNYLIQGKWINESYDPVRAEAAKKVFQGLGAEITELDAADNVKIEATLMRASELKKNIEALGGRWEKREIEGQGVCLVIIPPDESHKEKAKWDTFYQNTLLPMSKEEGRPHSEGFWIKTKKRIEGQEKEILITSKKAHLMPEIDAPDKKTKLVIFTEIAMPMSMRKRRVADWLGQGLDVALYNGHGMEDRKGIASEEASYEDASVVAEYLFKLNQEGSESKEYEPAKTLIFATCGSTFSGTYLVKKYHAEGINCLFEAPPTSLDAAIQSFSWVAKRVSDIAIFIFSLFSLKVTNATASGKEILHTSNVEIREKYKAEKDNWNSIKKIEGLLIVEKSQRKGFAIFIAITNDNLSTLEGVKSLSDAAQNKKSEVDYFAEEGDHFDNKWLTLPQREALLSRIHCYNVSTETEA